MLLPRRTAFEQRRTCIRRSSNRSSSRPCKRYHFQADRPLQKKDTSAMLWSQSSNKLLKPVLQTQAKEEHYLVHQQWTPPNW